MKPKNNRGMAIALSTIVILIVILLVLVVVATYFLGGFGSVGATIIGTGNDTQQHATGIGGELSNVLSGLEGGGTSGGGTSGTCTGTFNCATADNSPTLCGLLSGKGCSYDTGNNWCNPYNAGKSCSGLIQSTCVQVDAWSSYPGCTWS